MRSTAVPLVLGFLLIVAASRLSLGLAERQLVKPYDVLHLPSPAAARIAALGHRTTASDLYWLSAVQYVGDPAADERGYDKLFPLVDLVTELDPRHGYAYQTAGIVLSAAGRLDESDLMLRKGVQTGPRWWTFPYYLAFNSWFYRGDYAVAARYAQLAARAPGASPNISHLAVSLSSKSGEPEQAVALLRELRASVKDAASAERLDAQLNLAIVERDAQDLEKLVAELERRRGDRVASLDELVAAGMVATLPPDPFGGRYVWDADARKVRSSANGFRFEVRDAPHRARFRYRGPGARAGEEGRP